MLEDEECQQFLSAANDIEIALAEMYMIGARSEDKETNLLCYHLNDLMNGIQDFTHLLEEHRKIVLAAERDKKSIRVPFSELHERVKDFMSHFFRSKGEIK